MAFTVGYDADRIIEFKDMDLPSGSSFRNDEDAEKDWEDIVVVLAKGRTERIAKKIKKRGENFTKLLQEDRTPATS